VDNNARMGKRVFWREIWKRVRESPRVAKLGFDLLTWDACAALIFLEIWTTERACPNTPFVVVLCAEHQCIDVAF
jgi:hypothetical protein